MCNRFLACAVACLATVLITSPGAAAEQASSVSLTGVVFNDLNGDGLRSPGEPGLEGWTIGLLLTEVGFPDATSKTRGDGTYELTVPLTDTVVQADRIFVRAIPPTEPAGMMWVTTFVSSAFASIPESALLQPLGPGKTFVADFGKQLRPGTRATPEPRPPSAGTGLDRPSSEGDGRNWAVYVLILVSAATLSARCLWRPNPGRR